MPAPALARRAPETSPAMPRRLYDDANYLFVGHIQPRFTKAPLVYGPTGSTSRMTPRSGTVCWYHTLAMLTSDFSCNVTSIIGKLLPTGVPWPSTHEVPPFPAIACHPRRSTVGYPWQNCTLWTIAPHRQPCDRSTGSKR
uniref:Serine/threonine protein kinase n=1 Tax=Panagrellus redivivus TaxID=6233 RepID=A0A7E4VP71_PANRE